MIDIDVAEVAPHNACEFAKHRYNGIAKWRFLWTLLVFFFGSVLILVLAGLAVAIANGADGAAVITGLGVVVDGAAIAFVLARRKEAKEEEEAAYTDVGSKCQTTQEVDAVRRSLRVLGVR